VGPVALRPVGTAKRERQKANRQLKRQEEVKAVQRRKTKRTAVKVALGLAVALGVVLLLAQPWNNDDDPTPTTIIPADLSTIVGEVPITDPVPATTIAQSTTSAADTTAPDTSLATTSTSAPDTTGG
jgi:hypothetical protein